MDEYRDTITFWNDIFQKQEPKKDIESMKLHKDLEYAINWITDSSTSIIDYGCGSGNMLLKCASNKNVCTCLGIDISMQAVELGKKTAALNRLEDKIEFQCGGIYELEKIKENSFDAAILSNVIDNVTPDDAINIIKNISRIVIPNGKLFVKVNPYLEHQKLEEYGLKMLRDNFYIEKEGIYLRNLSTAEWTSLLDEYFNIKEYKEIYYEEYNQYNRMFLLTNNK